MLLLVYQYEFPKVPKNTQIFFRKWTVIGDRGIYDIYGQDPSQMSALRGGSTYTSFKGGCPEFSKQGGI